MDTRPSCRRSDLLRRICSLLPSDDARFIESLDPTSYDAYVHAYVALRRHQVPLDADLHAQVVEILFQFHDAQAAAVEPVRGNRRIGRRLRTLSPARPGTASG